MADYTVVNLKEVEDQAPKFGLSPQLEARMARVALGLENSGVSYQRISPGFRVPFGSARIKLEDDVVDLKPFDAVRVPKDTMRSFEAGPEGAEFIAIGAPNTGPGDADVVQDWWS
jgi:hypothetical protein